MSAGRLLRTLLALAGTCYAGPGSGVLLLAQIDWLILRLRISRGRPA